LLFLAPMALGIVFYGLYFSDLPVLTEARRYLFYAGFLDEISLSEFFLPTGENRRPISMAIFAVQNRLFGLDANSINLTQFAFLGLGASLTYFHLAQLIRNRFIALSASMLWLFSLSSADAAFWQATQHDKLSVVFCLSALASSHFFIRRQQASLVPISNLLILLLTICALGCKEISFILPIGLLAQVVLFSRGTDYLKSLAFVGLPVLYGACFIALDLLWLRSTWSSHVFSGDIASNLAYYFALLLNHLYAQYLSDFLGLASILGLAGLLIVGVAEFVRIARRGEAGAQYPLRTMAYLSVLLVGTLATVARLQFPVPYIVIRPNFAFLGLVAILYEWLVASEKNWTRIMARGFIALVVVSLLSSSYVEFRGGSRIAKLATTGRNMSQGYAILRQKADPQKLENIALVFPKEPVYAFFFLRGTIMSREQLVSSYIFGIDTHLKPSYFVEELPTGAADSKTLFLYWTPDFKLQRAEVGDEMIYQDPTIPRWPEKYSLGQEVVFGRQGNAAAYLGQGWSVTAKRMAWTVGREAHLFLELEARPQSDLVLVVDAGAMVAEKHPEQEVVIRVNRQVVGEWMITHKETRQERRVVIPADVLNNRGSLQISFRLRNPTSLFKLGVGKDRRAFGMSVYRVRIDEQ